MAAQPKIFWGLHNHLVIIKAQIDTWVERVNMENGPSICSDALPLIKSFALYYCINWSTL